MGRGSEKILGAWKAQLDDDVVGQIASRFEQSAATVDAVAVHGGAQRTGLSLGVSYSGDDGPQCGNDLQWWLDLQRKLGGGGWTPPRIIINGIPWPEIIQVLYDFGDTGPAQVPAQLPTQVSERGLGGGLR